jgi:hypothetical protein
MDPGASEQSSGALEVEPIIGRGAERHAFEAALDRGVGVVFVHGPAGVGKSTLVRWMVRAATLRGGAVRYLDARDFVPSPRTFRSELAAVGGALSSERLVVFVDTYELLGTIDDWLRRELWPSLPERATLVLSGRTPPGVGWTEAAAAGGRELLVLPLRNLGRDDAMRLLRAHGVADQELSTAVTATGGQPLALAMLGDLAGPTIDAPPASDDDGMVHRVLRRLLVEAVAPERRRALEAAAVVRHLDLARLAVLLDQRDVGELYRWLESLACMQRSRHGLCPHDFARDVIVAELRWREPAWFDTLVLRAHLDGMARFFQARAGEQLRILDEQSYLHRFNPMANIGLDWAACEYYPDEAGPDDLDALAAMIRRHEGDASVAVTMPWIARRPDETIVYRDRVGRPVGFLTMVALERATPAELAADPVAAQIWRVLSAADGPCAHGEHALLFRSWMSAAAHHAPSPIWNLVSHSMVREGLIRPKLGFSGGGFANPDFWEPFFAYFNLQRFRGAEYQLGPTRFGVFGNDHRLIPRREYGARLAERFKASPSGPVRPLVAPQPVLLERETFAKEVRRALRRLWKHASHRELLRSPLLYAPLVEARGEARGTASVRVEALRVQVEAALARVVAAQDDPRLQAVVQATFFDPQERKGAVVASALHLSFPTYRRLLAHAIELLVDELWQHETRGASRLP